MQGVVTLRLLQSDFYSLRDDKLKNSFLEILPVSVLFGKKVISVKDAHVLRFLSFQPTTFLTSSFVRYIDLGYQDWNFTGFLDLQEFNLRFGMGVSFEILRNTQFALIPYIGGRMFSLQNQGWAPTTDSISDSTYFSEWLRRRTKTKRIYFAVFYFQKDEAL